MLKWVSAVFHWLTHKLGMQLCFDNIQRRWSDILMRMQELQTCSGLNSMVTHITLAQLRHMLYQAAQ